jgi:vancomycin resistance protein YoaR
MRKWIQNKLSEGISLSPRTLPIVGSIVVISFVVLLVLLSLYQFMDNKHIARGVSIADISVSNMTPFEAKLTLEAAAHTFDQKEFILQFKDHEWKALPPELGASFEIEGAITDALAVGRSGPFLSSVKERIAALLVGKKIPLSAAVDKKTLDTFIETQMKMIEIPVQDRIIYYNTETKSFWINAPSNGKTISRPSLIQDIKRFAEDHFSTGAVQIAVTVEEPKISEGEALIARETAEKIAGTKYALVFEKKNYSISKSDILESLDFVITEDEGRTYLSPHFKEEKLKDVIMHLAPDINREPANAVLGQGENNTIIETKPGANGIEINTDETYNALQKNILTNPETEVAVSETLPAISKESLEHIGITQFLAKGESNFSGSPKNRISNIKVGAAKFNNVFIEKDAEFSFVKTLGAVDETTGYKPELVIKKNKTVAEFGGGLCQISTTMFRAAVYSGLSITERFPHAYPVTYYNPQGFDATIYPPHPDLRFINDTPGKILVQTAIEKTKLTFSFFGESDGREVKLIGPTITEKKPDGSMKTVLTQQVYKDGKLLKKKVFWSSYQSHALFPVVKNPFD